MTDRSPAARRIRRNLVYPVQGAAVFVLASLFRALPVAWASACGGVLLRFLGPLSRKDRIARRNLRAAFPDLAEPEIGRIMRGMWDNLGRGLGEFMHVPDLQIDGPDARIELVGAEHFRAAAERGAFVIFSAHMANWEAASVVAARLGCPLTNIYRHASIPIADRLMRRVRGQFCAEMIPKGAAEARKIILALKQGRPLGMLVDQKLNQGLAIPFFGRTAMTAPAPVELAYRFGCPLIPTRVERLPGVRFRVTIHPPMELPDTGDRQKDVVQALTAMNALLEDWIRERPEQWLWIHRRWPD